MGSFAGAGFEGEGTAEFLDAFFDAEDSGAATGESAMVEGEAYAVVVDVEAEFLVFMGEIDADEFGLGVFFAVIEGFLGDAEDAGFGGVGEIFADVGTDEFGTDAGAAGKVFELPLEGGAETEVVEEAGAEEEGDVADRADGIFGEFAGAGEAIGDGAGGEEGDGVGDFEAEGGEGLPDFVVEFAGEGAAFFFLDFEESSGEGFQFLEVDLAVVFGVGGEAEAESGDGDADGEGEAEEEGEGLGGGGAVGDELGLGVDEFLSDGGAEFLGEGEGGESAGNEDGFDVGIGSGDGGGVGGGEAEFGEEAGEFGGEAEGMDLLGGEELKRFEGFVALDFEFIEAGFVALEAGLVLVEEVVPGVDAAEPDGATEGGDGVVLAEEALVGGILLGAAGALEAEGFDGGGGEEDENDSEASAEDDGAVEGRFHGIQNFQYC